MPDWYWSPAHVAAVLGHIGRLDDAAVAIDRINALNPDFASNVEDETRVFVKDEAFAVFFLDGLRKAGLFDEPEAPSRPVIAVLPFTNMSGDPEQEYFADGITEDIITQLSRFQELGVIARNSTFQYKGQASDVRKVGSDLNASHIVEGSIRRSSDRIRVTVQLIDASDGNHLWSETYDRDLSAADVFAIQDDITARVATTIGDQHGVISRTGIEETRRKGPDNLSSYDCVLKKYEYDRLITEEAHISARDCLEMAVKRDANYAEAWAALSEMYAESHTTGFNPIERPVERALETAKKAQSLDPTNQIAQWSLAYAYFVAKDAENYIVNVERAVELNPNNAYLLGTAGWGLMLAGVWERGYSMIKAATDLNPYHPGWWHYPTTIYHYHMKQYEDALAEADKLGLPDFFWTPAMYAVIYAQQGRDTEAKQALATALEQNPDLANQPRFYISAYVFPEDIVEQIIDGLRLAGMDILEKPVN